MSNCPDHYLAFIPFNSLDAMVISSIAPNVKSHEASVFIVTNACSCPKEADGMR